MFDVIKFYKDYRIKYADEGSKHCRPGWVQIHCPFCHGTDWHLGAHLASGVMNCWKCGKKTQNNVIKALLACTRERANEIRKQYTTGKSTFRGPQEKIAKKKARTCVLPPGAIPMPTRHRDYLLKRHYDAEKLEKIWGLVGVGAVGSYKWRIIAPITLDGKLVSYQGRDITGKSSIKYKACESENEVIDHQNILYGVDQVPGNFAILTEGVTDCWRLGPGAICCFGIAFTTPQVNLIANRFKRVFILFDNEEQAQKQAEKIGILLAARGLEVEILTITSDDPGDMPQKEADLLMKELGF